MNQSPLQTQRVLEALVAGGHINPSQSATVSGQASRSGTRVEDVVLDLGLLTEERLLPVLADLYGVACVSSRALADASPSEETKARVSRKAAELFRVFPLRLDAGKNALVVVTADPDDEQVRHDLRMSASVSHVDMFVARPAAVEAAIAKHYRGEHNAFGALLRQRQPSSAGLELELEVAAPVAPAGELVFELEPGFAASSHATAGPTHDELGDPRSMAAWSDAIPLVNALVGALEEAHGGLVGHGTAVAKVCAHLAERLDLKTEHRLALRLAAHLHDLGKGEGAHLASLTVARYEKVTASARERYRSPVARLAGCGLPSASLLAIEHMYERYGGGGFPEGLAGDRIPIVARVLAVADAYADLVGNPANPMRRCLMPAEALKVLGKYAPQVFDPKVLHALSGG